MSWLHNTTTGGTAAPGQAGAGGAPGVDGGEGWGKEGGAELRKNVFGKYIWFIVKTSVNGLKKIVKHQHNRKVLNSLLRCLIASYKLE